MASSLPDQSSCVREFALLDLQLFDLRFQRRRRDSELGGCPARSSDPSLTLGQGCFDHLLFLTLQSVWERTRPVWTEGPLAREPRLVDRKRLAAAQDDRSLDDVLPFANIARPRISFAELQRSLL